MTLYNNQYRIESARCPNWDYTSNGYYFVTICTQDRQHFLGEITDHKMILSPIGEIIAEEWQKTAKIRPYVKLDEWVIMPNHLHGIIIIDRADADTTVETFRRNVSTMNKNNSKSRLQSQSLGSIIGQFKAISTKRIHQSSHEVFMWQKRFYDHIIRDEESLSNIKKYILENPQKWQFDRDKLPGLYI